jgi:hypothetical protein
MKEIEIQNAFLSFMPYIYHIVVDSVLIGLDSTFNNEGDIIEWVNVSATILDIIKGKPPCNCKMAGGKYDSFLNDSLNKSCINFGYPKDNPTKIGFDVGWGSNTTLHTLKKGEELIVFLKGNSLNDKDFIVIPSWFYEETGGLFMIKDGYVIDSANFWGSGNLKVAEFKEMLRNKIEIIKSWLYFPTNINEEIFKSDSISIFPNPFDNITNLCFTVPYDGCTVNISVFDEFGKMIIAPVEKLYTQGIHRYNLESDNISSGLYYCRIRICNKIYTQKLVVIK